MSTIKSSDSSNLSLIQSLIANNRTQYNTLTQKISSGVNYLKRSENTAETNRAAVVDKDQAQNTQWGKNSSYVGNWETATYSYLSDISDQFKSAVSVATEANNTINEPSGWDSLASQLDSVISSMTADGNAKYLGTSIFAGTKTSDTTDTFTTTTNAAGLTDIVYNGSQKALATAADPAYRSIKTSSSSSSSTDYGTLGEDVFAGVSVTKVDSTTGAKTTRSDFNSLQALVDMKDYLSAKGSLTTDQLSLYQSRYGIPDASEAPDAATIFGRMLNVVQNGSAQVSQTLADNSARSQRIDSLTNTIASSVSTDENQYNSIMGLDTVKAATDLSNIETVLQASLTLAGNISKMSIVNYI